MRETDVIVVGAGVMGLATARALASAGKRVIVLEQFAVGHRQGSSHGISRAFTFAHPDPQFVAMATDAEPMWRALERETGTCLLTSTGALLRPGEVATIVAALEANGQRCELLGAEDVATRFGIRLPDDAEVIFQPRAGTLAAHAALRALLTSAASQGAELQDGTCAKSLRPTSDGVVVESSAGEIRAEAVVVTAGGWAPALLSGNGIELTATPTRETIAFYDLPGAPVPALFEHGEPPVYSVTSPGEGLKVGEHHAGPAVEVPASGTPSPESVARLTDYVRERFPMAADAPSRAETCVYTNTPDERFVLERHERIVAGCACDGQGFKFAPVVGERLSDLTLELWEERP